MKMTFNFIPAGPAGPPAKGVLIMSFNFSMVGIVGEEDSGGRRPMIICHCAGVTDCAIRMLVDAGASSVAEITRLTGAGECCPPCREEIAALLYSSTAASHNPA
jgi:assimilatory nitrate reductase electron transfer subunit